MDKNNLWRKFWYDKDGHIAIWQFPNLPLIAWVLCMVAAMILSSSRLKTGTTYLGTAFLFTWAYLEIAQGVSYFRRLLGVVVLIEIVLSHVK